MSGSALKPTSRRTDPSLADTLNDGWVRYGSSGVAVYVSGTSFKITGRDVTADFTRGRKIRIYHATSAVYKYVVVVSSAYVTDTTVTVTGDTLLSETYSTIWLNNSPVGFTNFLYELQAMLDTPGAFTQGDLLYINSASQLKKLAIGSAGQRLSVSSGVPAWVNDDGWREANETWTYLSATTITVPTGAASKYSKGDKIKLTQTTVKYFYVVGVADTVLTVTGGADYTVANAAITSPYYSKTETPVGFPDYFNSSFTPGNVTVGNGALVSRFKIDGLEIKHWGSFTLGSTSSASGVITIFSPVNTHASYISDHPLGKARFYDNSTTTGYPGTASRKDSDEVYVTISITNDVYGTAANISNAIPVAPAQSDIFSWSYSAEIA